MDSGMDIVADNNAEFTFAGIEQCAGNFGFVIAAVMSQVGGNRAGAEIGQRTDYGIADITQMSGADLVHQQAVLDFHRLADMAVVADISIAAQIAVGADLAVFADNDFAFDINSGQQHGTGA